ncbi:MAG: type II CAAX endopeptidase family protein [Cyanobacteria bacterium P01_A01_bin.135]
MRRIVLAGLTLLVVVLSVGPALFGSLQQQQIAGRLELNQANLMLQAQELSMGAESDSMAQLRQALMGESLEGPIEAYQSVRDQTARQLQPGDLSPEASSQPTLSPADPAITQDFLDQVDLRLGILQAEAGNLAQAQERWQGIAASADADPSQVQIAQVLLGLWSDAPTILPDAEPQIQRSLQGWFQIQALEQLYELQQRRDALQQLDATTQTLAQQSATKLGLLGLGPALGGVVGVGLLVFLGIQRLAKGKGALLAQVNGQGWATPWNWEVTWQVLIVGFFFVGQIVLPLVLLLARGLVLGPLLGSASSGRVAAASTLVAYLLLAASSLAVLYVSIKPYLSSEAPLQESDLFKFRVTSRWPLWGLGGYFAAVPLVIGVSVINQQLWQGRGGSNPLLQIVLDETDPVALGLFFFTAAVAAPVFEEILFRGFLLPSLTRYMAVWPAIALSAFIFAAAHLSVSEILPLMVLGIVLGFVYTRSRSLLAPMLVHSLWNSATMLGLFILGSVE